MARRSGASKRRPSQRQKRKATQMAQLKLAATDANTSSSDLRDARGIEGEIFAASE